MSREKVTIHQLSDVLTIKIGNGSKIWQFVVILPGAIIGEDCNICSHCLIENEVVIGNRVTVKSGVQVWDGITLEDDVFIGPNVSFTNDKNPRSKKFMDKYPNTIIKRGASIGANATILPGIIIGENAMVGAGSVVTKNIPNSEVWVGNPAKFLKRV